MTDIEKAIEALESSGDYMETCDCDECSWKHAAIAALHEKAELANPAPLTIEQLQEMNREPLKHWVWIEILDQDEFHYDAISGYYRTQSDFSEGEAFCCGWPGVGTAIDDSDYGKTWLAYATRPNGEVEG